jgi:hypothetical protein
MMMNIFVQPHGMKKFDDCLDKLGLRYEYPYIFKSLPYQGDVQNLKSQVMTLIKESQELSAKLDMSDKALDKKSTR